MSMPIHKGSRLKTQQASWERWEWHPNLMGVQLLGALGNHDYSKYILWIPPAVSLLICIIMLYHQYMLGIFSYNKESSVCETGFMTWAPLCKLNGCPAKLNLFIFKLLLCLITIILIWVRPNLVFLFQNNYLRLALRWTCMLVCFPWGN